MDDDVEIELSKSDYYIQNRVLVKIEGIEYEVVYPANISESRAVDTFKKSYYYLKSEGPEDLFAEFVNDGLKRMVIRKELSKYNSFYFLPVTLAIC